MIIGISGLAGSGKDQFASYLVQDHGFVVVSLADPLKRICREVFDFTEEQLWGPSEKRNEPDRRYEQKPGQRKVFNPNTNEIEDHGPEYLTPRHALQQLGTEWGRACYENIWVEYALRVAKELLDGGFVYTSQRGLESEYGHPRCPQYPYHGVVIPDVRFKNEMASIKKAGGKLIRIYRPDAGLKGTAGTHPSEAEQMSIPDGAFDTVINNMGTLDQLRAQASTVLRLLRG